MTLKDAIDRGLPSHLPSALRALGDLAAAHQERLYLVGGAVRDLLLGLSVPVREVDLVLVGDVSRLAREAEAAGIARRTAHSQFMTLKLEVAGHGGVDLVTARRERYRQPGALPEVEPAGLDEDLKRRDFSINAMAVSLAPSDFGEIVDRHEGQQDLRAKRVRALHERSFQDDATRILRAARYAARFGFQLETRTEAWLRRDAAHLREISADRLRHELDRIWGEPAPEAVLELLAALGALPRVHPALRWDAARREAFRRARADRPSDIPLTAVCWALLSLGPEPGRAAESVARLNLPPDAARAVLDAAALIAGPVIDASPSRASETLGRYDDAAIFAAGVFDPERGETLLRFIHEWRHIRPALTGRDLLALGTPEGPLVGVYLARLRAARLDGTVRTEAEERYLVAKWRGAPKGPA